jgi:hypothetical protein
MVPGLEEFTLTDAAYKPFKLLDAVAVVTAGRAVVTREFTLTFQQPRGHGDPKLLAFVSRRVTDVEVPFTLKDVPLK